MTPGPVPRYAVLFKTYFWDDFAARRFAALDERCAAGDLWVVVDDTRGFVPGISHDKVFRPRAPDFARLGLPDFPVGNPHWYNVDYQLLAFQEAHGDYPYYVMVEHDAVVLRDLDSRRRDVPDQHGVFVAMPGREPVRPWGWRPTLLGSWAEDSILYFLLNIAIFSHRAVEHLARRRRIDTARFASKELPFWPFCEGHVPTIMADAGFSIVPLDAFGSTDHMDWWPPYHESDLAGFPENSFAHPVLTGRRYVDSLLRYAPPEAWFQPASRLRAKLDQEAPELVVTALIEHFMIKEDIDALIALRRAVDDLGWHDCAFPLEPLVRPSRVAGDARELSEGSVGARRASRFWSDPSAPDPWRMVDLGGASWITAVSVRDHGANPLSIWHSTDGRRWEMLERHTAGLPEDRPFVVECPEGLVARFVRVELRGLADPVRIGVVVLGMPLTDDRGAVPQVTDPA